MGNRFNAYLIALFMVIILSTSTFSNQLFQFPGSYNKLDLLDQNEENLTIECSIGELIFTDILAQNGTYTLAAVEGFSQSKVIGEPSLPVLNKLIAVPYDCKLSYKIISSSYEDIDLTALGIQNIFLPVQPSLSKSDDPMSVSFEMNENTYKNNAFYSLPLIKTSIEGVMRGVRIGMVSISPFSYNPVTNKLRVYNEIKVEIQYENPDWSRTYESWNNYYSPLYQSNYDRLMNFNTQFRSVKSDLVTYPTTYLIISDRMFEAQLQPFIEWKTKKGFNVITAYTDVIGSSNTVIKNYIESVYNDGTPQNPAPSFVLFVGDAQQIPPFDGQAGSHITDLPFCEFTNDNFPEIYYGRFSAQNTAQLQPQIDKTLEYEQYLMPDPSYLEEVILVAGVDGTYAPTHGNGQINYGTQQYFNAAHGIVPHVWLYPASDGSGASGDIIQEIDDGAGFFNYTAHCSHTGHADPSFTTADVPGLTNYHQYLLGIGNCCLANTFGDDYSTPCLGEAFLQIEDRGGIGYIGASNSTYWDEDYWWGVGNGPVVGAGPTYEQTGLGTYDGLFHDHGEPVSEHYITNSAMIFAGNMAVTEAGSSRTQYYWEAYHLMGDPSVMTYLGIPQVNNVTHDPIVLIAATDFTVQADPGSYVAISFNGELQGAAYVDATGSVSVPLTGFATPGVADIVVTAQNKQPYISTLQVITPSGPYCVFDYSVIDDSFGNSNGLAELGESITLGVQLINVGPDDAIDVTAGITSADSYVSIIDDNAAYGTITANNGTGYVADAFAFDISLDVPDGHVIQFDLTINSTNRETWNGTILIPVHAPLVEFVSLSFDDAAGNNNGILDPGESADMIVTLVNNGSSQAVNVSAMLSTTDAYLLISDNEATFGLIDSASGTADNTADIYSVSADSDCPLGYAVPVTFDVTSEGGYTTTLSASVTVGDRVVLFYDDFAYDQGWTGLGGTAEWTIGNPMGAGGDPSEDYSPTSDNNVLGNDLTSSGSYNNSISGTQWVYSPQIDCAAMSGIIFSYYRWLGVESSSYDHAYLEVFDGTDWITLYQNESSSFQDNSWNFEEYDLSAVADGNPNFQIRYGLGSTDGSATYSGWNIDDITLRGYGYVGTPALEYSVDEITDSLQPGDLSDKQFVVRNIGDGTLRVLLTCDDEWLTVPADMMVILPGDSALVDINIDGTALTCGTNICSIDFTSNDNSAQSGSIPVSVFVYTPDISVIETNLSQTVSANDTVYYPLTISNLGEGRLIYQVSCQMYDKSDIFVTSPKTGNPPQATSAAPLGYQPADGDKSATMEAFYSSVDKNIGGPDTFGHNWIDSDEPGGPTPAWVDISSVGTAVTLGDDDFMGPFPIGFNFPFYDSTYSQCYIGSNGFITFDEGSGDRSNLAMPAASMKAMVAGWWDDLDPRKTGNVYYYYDAASGRFIVSFENISLYYSTTGTGSLSFQFILNPDGKILLQYGTMDSGVLGFTSGSVGIQNSTADDGLTVTYNAAYMHSDLAIEFSAKNWLQANPSGGVVEPFSDVVVNLMFNAAELEENSYTGMVMISSNDPDYSAHPINVTMNVSTWICMDVNADQELNVADLVYLIAYSFDNGPPPIVMATADATGDGEVNIGDIVMIVNYMFNSGTAPTCGK